MKLFSFFVLLYNCHLFLAQPADRSTLRFSQVIFRHGDRNPRRVYGRYAKNNITIWPEGLEQLTNLGKKQAIELGQFFRQRYDGFLSSSYRAEEILVISSHMNRCIKTALSCVLGLYQKYNDTAIESKDVSPHDAIPPIRTVPAENDRFFTHYAYCPKRNELETIPYKTFFEQRYFKDEPETLEYVFKESGQRALFDRPLNSTKIHEEYYAVEETIHCLVFANKPLEEWMKPLLDNELFLAYPYYLQLAENSDGLQKQRLKAGPLLEMVLDNFAAHLNGTLTQRIMMFSAHDSSIVNIMNAFSLLSVLMFRLPPYASTLLVELHQIPDIEEPVIEFWYRKSTTKTLEKVDSTPCGIPCTLPNLLKSISHLINVDYENECKIMETH